MPVRRPLLAAVLAAVGALAQSLTVQLEAPIDLTSHGTGDAAARLRVLVGEEATGANVAAAQVVLSMLTYMPASDQEAVIQTASGAVLLPEQPESGVASVYSVEFASLFAAEAQPQPGLYRLDLMITSLSAGPTAGPEPASVTAKVNAAIEPIDFKIMTRRPNGTQSELLEYTAQHPTAVPETVNLDGATHMTVRLRVRYVHDGSYVQPHQAMVHLTSDHDQESRTVVVATPLQDDPDMLEAQLVRPSRTLADHTGDCTMQIVVGDFFANNAVVWDVATISLPGTNGTGVARGTSPATPQPVIKHRFRDPEPENAPVLSVAFAAAAVAPSFLLMLALLRVGVNTGGCTRMSSGKVVAVVAFHVCTAAMLYLLVAFWISGTLGDTAAKLAPTAVASLLLGWIALREEPSECALDEQEMKVKAE